MIPHKNASISILVSLLLVVASSAAGETVELPDSPILMRAMVDEINRSLELQMEDLDQPYFIQYTVDDVINYEISAAYGTITRFNPDRSRRFFVHTRVGSFELDNTNFRDPGRFVVNGTSHVSTCAAPHAAGRCARQGRLEVPRPPRGPVIANRFPAPPPPAP